MRLMWDPTSFFETISSVALIGMSGVLLWALACITVMLLVRTNDK